MRVIVRNASLRTVFIGATSLSVPTPSFDDDAATAIIEEIGCLCDCQAFSGLYACNAARCALQSPVPDTYDSLEPGGVRELTWQGGDRRVIGDLKCAESFAFRLGAELAGTFCWYDEDPNGPTPAPSGCLDTPFRYGDDTLEVIIPAGEPAGGKDASAADEDAGPDEDGGTSRRTGAT
jgi:hypothetical protein